jgi:ABC-type phosphate transport system auxiliary subunit
MEKSEEHDKRAGLRQQCDGMQAEQWRLVLKWNDANGNKFIIEMSYAT